MNNSKINALIFMAIGVFIGIALCTIFTRSYDVLQSTRTKTVSPTVIKKEVAKSEVQYQQQIQRLQQNNSQWQAKSQAATQALTIAKRKTVQLEQALSSKIAKDKTLSSGGKDSLYQSLNDYTLIGNEKDSLCTEITTALQEQIINKDSTIEVQNKQYDFLKGSLELSLAQQETAIAEAHLYKKQMKRERTKKRFISAGLLVVGGIATYSLLQR